MNLLIIRSLGPISLMRGYKTMGKERNGDKRPNGRYVMEKKKELPRKIVIDLEKNLLEVHTKEISVWRIDTPLDALIDVATVLDFFDIVEKLKEFRDRETKEED